MSTQVVQGDDEVTVITAPKRLGKQITDLSRADKQVLWLMGALSLVMLREWGFPGLFLGGVVGFVLILPFGLARMWEMPFIYIRSMWRVKVKKNKVYEASDKAKVAPTKFYPIRVDDMGEIGLCHTTSLSLDSVAIRVTGVEDNLAALRVREGFNAAVADLLYKVAGQKSFNVKVSFMRRPRPYNSIPLFAEAHERLLPKVYQLLEHVADARTEYLEKHGDFYDLSHLDLDAGESPDDPPQWIEDMGDEWVRSWRQAWSFLEEQEFAVEDGSDTEMVVILTVKRDPRLVKAAKGKPLKEDEVSGLAVTTITQMVRNQLEAIGATGVEILDPAACKDFVRASFDEVNLQEYYFRQLEGEVPYRPTSEISVGQGWAYVDGTYHSTLRVTGMPKYLYPNHIDELYAVNRAKGGATVTMLGRAMTGTREYVLSSAGMNLVDMFRDAATIADSVRSDRKRQERLARQEEVDEDYAEYTNIVIGVTSSSMSGLEEQVRGVEQSIGAGWRLERIMPASLQIPWMISCNTGINLT